MRLDAIVIGGSFAGLSAATYLARGRRRVGIIDKGLPRNRFAAHSHGFLTHDGSAPHEMLATARAQVAAYPTITFVEGEAVRAAQLPDGFAITLASGEELECRKLVLAFGISDELPPIPGLAERWGNTVIHCPYCHGFEFSDRRLGVLNMSPMSAHQAMLVAEWGLTTFYLNGHEEPDAATLAELQKRGVSIEHGLVEALLGDGAELSAIQHAGGRTSTVDALYVGPRNRFNSDIAQQLGCQIDEAPFGSIIRTDEWKMTTVAGVFAAGDITRGAHTVAWACSDGVTAGVAAHRSLIF